MNIDPQKPYCVYFHLIEGVLFYIGSGVLSRSLDHGAARRNQAWNIFTNGRRVSVEIEGYYETRAEARQKEYTAIRLYRPIANLPYDPSGALEWSYAPADGRAFLVATDNEKGTRIRMVDATDGRLIHIFATVRQAAALTGISAGAISNSITGRYLIVAGRRFIREPRPGGLLWTPEEQHSTRSG